MISNSPVPGMHKTRTYCPASLEVTGHHGNIVSSCKSPSDGCSCEIEDFVETDICNIFAIFRSRVLRGGHALKKDIGRRPALIIVGVCQGQQGE